MRVTVDVKGEGTSTIDLESIERDGVGSNGADRDGTAAGDRAAGQASGADAESPDRATDAAFEPTYADLLAAVELSPHEVSVLVDGRPVPEDQPVDAEHVTVLRMIKGG